MRQKTQIKRWSKEVEERKKQSNFNYIERWHIWITHMAFINLHKSHAWIKWNRRVEKKVVKKICTRFAFKFTLQCDHQFWICLICLLMMLSNSPNKCIQRVILFLFNMFIIYFIVDCRTLFRYMCFNWIATHDSEHWYNVFNF